MPTCGALTCAGPGSWRPISRGPDLAAADVLGADLRDTDVRRADLSEVLFLPQAQINAARDDHDTRLPAALSRPAHW